MGVELERFSFEALKPALLQENVENNSKTADALNAQLSFLTEFLLALDAKDILPEDASFLLDQLNLLVDHYKETFTKDGEEILQLTRPIIRLLSKAYAVVFQTLLETGNSKFSIKLIDLSTNLSEILLKNVKKLSLKTNWYSTLKHMATIILQFIFTRFNGFLNSFKASILNSLYKHLSKCYDNYNSSVEHSRFNASYFCDLLLLIDIILANDTGSNVLDDKLLNRLVKLSKNITAKHNSNLSIPSKEGYTFPILSVVFANNYLVHLLKSDRFISAIPKSSRTAKTGSYLNYTTSYLHRYVDAMDTSYKKLRLSLAKNLADLLIFNYISYGVNTNDASGSLDMTLEFIFDGFLKNSHSPRIRVGLLETFSTFVLKMNLYHQTNSISTGTQQGNNFASVSFFKIFNFIQSTLFLSEGEAVTENSLASHKIARNSNFNEALTLLDQLESLYKLLLREVDCDINKLIILSKLLLGDVDANSDLNVQYLDDLSNPFRVLSALKLAQLLIKDLDQYILSQQEGFFDGSSDLVTAASQKLFHLCKVSNFEIRVTATETLSLLIKVKPELTFGILNDSLGSLIRSLDDSSNDNSFVFNENQGLAFLISTILTRAPKDYINSDFILRVFSTTTNFLKKFNSTVITNNVLSTSSGSFISNTGYDKQLISWIMLMGLFNFASTGPSNSSFFLMESSLFLNIWKTLLGHTIPSTFVKVSPNNQISNLNEIMKLVEIKNHSLACLLSYINYLASTKNTSALATHLSGQASISLLTPELAKQLNQILNKSFTFVGNLESQVGKAEVPGLTDQLKVTKLRMLQSLLKLLPYMNIRSEFNSSLLIQIVNTFSDPKVYSYVLKAEATKFHKTKKRADSSEEDELEIYGINDGLTFGLTSKMNMFKVDELMVKATDLEKQSEIDDYELDYLPSPFSNSSVIAIESYRTRSHLASVTDFDEYFENKLFQPIQHSMLLDYLMVLVQNSDVYGYTDVHNAPVSIDTMSVDVCIELFAITFPSIPLKIQQSILETLRAPIFYANKGSLKNESASESTTEGVNLRRQAASINTAVAIHGMLNYMSNHNNSTSSKSKLYLPKVIVSVLVDTLHLMKRKDHFMLALNSESIGLCCSLLSDSEKDFVSQQTAILINKIVEDNDPYSRSFHVQSLAKICEFGNVANPSSIVNVAFSLIADPHPIVHQWSMDALVTILGSQTQFEFGTAICSKVLSHLVRMSVKDEFGLSSKVTIFSNMSFDSKYYSSNSLARMVRSVVNVLGPTVVLLDETSKKNLSFLLFGLMYMENNDFEIILRELIKTLEELQVFDKSLVSNDQYAKLLKFAIVNNFRTGFYNNSMSFLPLDDQYASGISSTSEFYPVSTSRLNWGIAVNTYHQMLKLHPNGSYSSEVFTEDVQKLLWICYESDPDNRSIQSTCNDWLDYSMGLPASSKEKYLWFDKLVGYFNIPKAELYAALLAVFKKRINNSGMFFDLKNRSATVAVSKKEPSSKNEQNANDEEDSQSGNDGDSVQADDEEALAGDDSVAVVDHGEQEETDKPKSNAYTANDALHQMVENEPTSWKFKLRVLGLLTKLLQYTRRDQKLKLFISTKISEFVRIAFVCATSNIMYLRLSGLKLLGDIIEIYADMKDPLYPESSIMDQQQAQMISAIVPAFGKDSSLDLAGEAIVIASKLVTSHISHITKMSRVVKILTTSLEEFSLSENTSINDDGNDTSNTKTMKIGEIPILTSKNKNKVKLSVLDAWAKLKINSTENDEDLNQMISKYLGILVPMWIYSMREFAMLKFGSDFTPNSTDDVELETYENHWIDFLEVLSLVLREDEEQFTALLGGDISNFAFVLFGQCIEFLVKSSSNTTRMREGGEKQIKVLASLNRLLMLDTVAETIFKDSVFIEFIDLLNRLVLVVPTDAVSHVVEISTNAFMGYFKTAGTRTVEELHNDVDKLFELLRVNMHVITTVLPMVADGEVNIDKVRRLSETDLVLVRTCFSALVEMIEKLPEIIKVDLYTCLLFVLKLIYELNDSELITIALPTLRKVFSGLLSIDRPEVIDAITNFYFDLSPVISNRDDKNTLVTVLILLTSCREKLVLTKDESSKVATVFINGLVSSDHLALTIQSIKNLINQASTNKNGCIGSVVEQLIPKLIILLVSTLEGSAEKAIRDPRLVLEMLVIFSKSLKEESDIEMFYSILIPLLVWFDTASGGSSDPITRKYTHLKLIDLIAFNPELFKKVINDGNTLNADGSTRLEILVRFDASSVQGGDEIDGNSHAASTAAHIELKTFG
ncbi:unnamed protein product [Kuraishia capsulata CBS 1993]|uniref:LAA1-like C-terminal TPR repeats domain-containing protein n=1 Tax=Kuraishia capsulata CBS 1993 TaxID=1382522 RepID=W6MQT4_9ASCO|nr:uncharacterized protein KUCA_T00005086001 [Kuraishia capsulata CBS 1993]CDK29099.1 unnamed protein product [Kuraishia capsulata CBS 1993]